MHTHVALQREGGQMMFLRATSIPVRPKNVDGRTMAVSTTRSGGRPPQTGGVIIFLHASLACLLGAFGRANYAAQRNQLHTYCRQPSQPRRTPPEIRYLGWGVMQSIALCIDCIA